MVSSIVESLVKVDHVFTKFLRLPATSTGDDVMVSTGISLCASKGSWLSPSEAHSIFSWWGPSGFPEVNLTGECFVVETV